MKITYLTGEYPPMQGGIADHTAYLAHHLIKLENTFPSVLTARRWQESEVERPIHLAAADARHPIIYPLLSGWGRPCWAEIRRFLETYRPDVLHIQYQAAAFDLGGWVNWLPRYLTYRRLPTRLVTTFHDLRIPYIFPKAGPFRWYSMMTLARHSHGIICTNREDLQTLATELGVKPYQLMNNISVEHKPSPQPSPKGRGSQASPPVGADKGRFFPDEVENQAVANEADSL
ncbi:MAG: glycosyltransferase, partial [Anaerolineae bacterium]|nr:glycosyltransferase [Anaerolineae bacterium]